MKILMSSHFFHPSVGGIEQVSLTLAREFAKAGHELKVVTSTPDDQNHQYPFEVIRRPMPWTLLKLVKWCDVYFHNNISLKTAWPLLFVKKPWVVSHHTWLTRITGRAGLRDWMKQYLIRRASNISVSTAVAEHLSSPSKIIGNPYRDDVFRRTPGPARRQDLIFLGRLVWDKGTDLLIDAIAMLRSRGVKPGLLIVGDGPELIPLCKQVLKYDLNDQVKFGGTRTGEELVTLLNNSKVMMIPSRWQEPFGLVALEGIACGCVAIGAECGGLPGVIGNAGITFECGDVKDMAVKIESLLGNQATLDGYRARAEEHLRQFTAEMVARRYLEVLEEARQ